MSRARAWTRTAGSGIKRTNHEAIAPPSKSPKVGKVFVLELNNRFQCQQVIDEGKTIDVIHDAKSDYEYLVG